MKIFDWELDFWAKVDQRGPDECWPWLMSVTNQGYGQMVHSALPGTGHATAHRLAYEYAMIDPDDPEKMNEIPRGMQVDHICHNADRLCKGGPTCRHRRCCNPNHLDMVTNAVNKARANAQAGRGLSATYCKHGHALTPDNTWVGKRKGHGTIRQCKACLRDRAWRRKYGTERPANTTPIGTGDTCKNGHLWVTNAKYDSTTGKKRCRTCEQIRDRAAKERRKALK